MIFDAIKAYWEDQKEDRAPDHIGMSAIGHCGRQLAYKFHGIPGIPLDWRTKVIFDDGDMHHEQLRRAIADGLVLTNSCYSLCGEEDEVTLGVLRGHVDGILVHDKEACQNSMHHDMLLEVKSMNDRSFNELKKTNKLSFEYRAQVSAYLRAGSLGRAYILAKNKNNGDIYCVVYEGEDDLLDNRLTVLGDVLASTTAEDIRREYHAKASGDLEWQCNYCPFVKLCWRHEGVVELSPRKYKLVDNLRPPVTKSVISNTDASSKGTEKVVGTEVATVTNVVSEIHENSVENKRKKRKGRKG